MYASKLLYMHTQSSELFYQMANNIMMFPLPPGTLSLAHPNYIIMIFCRIVTKYNSFIIIMARTKFISSNILNPNAEISCDILFEENWGN